MFGHCSWIFLTLPNNSLEPIRKTTFDGVSNLILTLPWVVKGLLLWLSRTQCIAKNGGSPFKA